MKNILKLKLKILNLQLPLMVNGVSGEITENAIHLVGRTVAE